MDAAQGLSIVSTRRSLAILAGFVSAALSAAAVANPAVALDSAVFVERGSPASGKLLEPAGQLTRGDRLVYVVNWQRTGGNGGFIVTNPLPRSVYYQGSAHGDEEISVDGGRSWGRLGALRVGARLATAEDVTHVRWKVDPRRAALGSGRIAYSAIVR